VDKPVALIAIACHPLSCDRVDGVAVREAIGAVFSTYARVAVSEGRARDIG
jgi:hypothetical protein